MKRAVKKFFNGNHRTCNPTKTKQWVLKQIEKSQLPVFGKIKQIDHMDYLGIPVFAVSHPDVFGNCGKPSWGKGITEDLALVSALMERVERYSASDVNTADFLRAKYVDIKDHAISRWDLVPCNLQRKQYSKRIVDRQELLWTKCRSLTKKCDIYVPANAVYFVPAEKFNDFSYTTGLASGNTLEEAILHGLCEVIERHVEEIIHMNKVKCPTIDLNSVTGKAKELVERFLEKGFHVYLNQIDSSYGLPIIRAFAYEKKGPYAATFGQYTSVGVHTNKEIAIIRALTEIAQSRSSNKYHLKTKTQNIQIVPEFPGDIYTFFSDIISDEVIDFKDIKNASKDDIAQEIRALLKILHAKGHEVIIKDLTHPILKVPVVRVIVTGMQPGNLGVGIVNLTHRAASITPHLKDYGKLLKEIKQANY